MVDLKIILNEDKDIEAVVGDELCHLSANAQDTMLYKTETNALVRWLTSPTFESIERLAFDVYAGENLEKQAARYLGGMVPFSAEPVQYALSVAQRQLLIEAYQAGEELTGIRVVLTDADADGRVDAFVSSNEKAIGDIFSWSLYLNTETGWEKATETIIRGHGVIEPEVVARESEFYQVYEIDILSYPNQVPPWPLILRREAVYAYAQPVFYMGFPDRLSAFHLANQIRESDLPPQASIPLQAVLQLFDMRSAFQRLERLSAETLSLEP